MLDNFGSSSSGDSGATLVDGAAGPQVVLPEGFPIVDADFARQGSDLVLEAPDGDTVVVQDFFAQGEFPLLTTPDGGRFPGEMAVKLAGPQAPGQYAQAGPAEGAQPIGQIETLDGTVTATRADGTQVELEVGDPVYQGDILETGPAGAVGVVFADETVFSMAEDGRMVLDEMVYDPGTGDGSMAISAVKGVFTFVSGQIAKADPDAMTVETPVATIGIRGTQGGIDLADGQTLNVVLMTELVEQPDGTFREIVGEILVSIGDQVYTINQSDFGMTADATGALSAPRQFSVDEIKGAFAKAHGTLGRIRRTSDDYGTQGGNDDDDLAAEALQEDGALAAGDAGDDPEGDPVDIEYVAPADVDLDEVVDDFLDIVVEPDIGTDGSNGGGTGGDDGPTEIINLPPTGIVIANATVAENANGAIVGAVSATDPNGDTLAFTVDDDRFEIVGGNLKLRAGETLDFETEPTVTVSIVATDPGGLSATQTFEIGVLGVNEAPTDIALDNDTVAENVDGAIVGALTASDPDGDAVAFTVDDDRFEVVGGNLKLKTGEALDFESEPEVTVDVTATDPGGLSVTETFDIDVTDVSEDDPEFLSFEDFESGSFGTFQTTGTTAIIGGGNPGVGGTYVAQLGNTGNTGSVLVADLENFVGIPSGTLNAISSGQPTAGSAMKAQVDVQAGDTISFDWFFFTEETTGPNNTTVNDFAFFSFDFAGSDGAFNVVAASNLDPSNNLNDSTFLTPDGWMTSVFTAPQSGTLTIGIGVSDLGDQIVDSFVQVDNVALNRDLDGFTVNNNLPQAANFATGEFA